MDLFVCVVDAQGDESIHFSRSQMRETICKGAGGCGVVGGEHHHHLSKTRKLPPYGH